MIPNDLRLECIEGAAHIGVRLVKDADWRESRCGWQATRADYTINRGRPDWKLQRVGPTLYSGTAGIALFLSELGAVTGDSEVRATARGALQHAVAAVDALGPASFGFHSGRVGIAFALARHATITGDEWGAETARRVLAPLFGHEREDRGLDVIAGAAGAVAVLLQLSDVLSIPLARESAVALGEHLVETAHRSPEGWSWSPVSYAQARDLTGLAHGAAGCGVALLELWAATGTSSFRYGAEQAFAYEAQHFDPVSANWRDYRNSVFGEILVSPDSLEALRQALRAGAEAPSYRPACMTAWCHGAPGIGMTRVRGYTLLGDRVWADQARMAVRTTQNALGGPRGNYSLCHGAFGNCECILYAADSFGERGWQIEVEEWVREALAEYGMSHRPWPSGTHNGLPDPTLMLGEAGIGYFLLRFAGANAPSVLLPTITPPRAFRTDQFEEDASYQVLREADERSYFGTTSLSFERLGVQLGGNSQPADVAHQATPVLAFAEEVSAAIAGARDRERAAILEDASRVDMARVNAILELPAFSDELAERLRRRPGASIDWGSALLRLAPCTRLLSCDRDWDTWLTDTAVAGDRSAPRKVEGGIDYVLYRATNTIRVLRVGQFAALVLAELARVAGTSGATAADVADRFIDADASAADVQKVRAIVVDQLRRAYDAGFVTEYLAPSIAWADTVHSDLAAGTKVG